MKYEIENYGYLDQIIIETRYLLLGLMLLCGVIAIQYLSNGINIRFLVSISIVLLVVIIRVHFIAYK